MANARGVTHNFARQPSIGSVLYPAFWGMSTTPADSTFWDMCPAEWGVAVLRLGARFPPCRRRRGHGYTSNSTADLQLPMWVDSVTTESFAEGFVGRTGKRGEVIERCGARRARCRVVVEDDAVARSLGHVADRDD